MIDLPDSPEALFAAIPDEEAARTYLTQLRWPDGVACAFCASRRVVPLSTRPEWWSCADCKGQTSLRSQTVLHGSRKPLLDWIYVMWAVAHPQGPSVLQAAGFLGARYATLFVMFHKIRAALAERAGYELEGDAIHVAFGWFGPTKHASGDPRSRQRVLVAVSATEEPGVHYSRELRCSSLGCAFVPPHVVDDVLQAHVAPGSGPQVELRPPMWGPINSDVPAVRRPFLRFLQWIELRFRGVSRRYLGNYLAQFVYRANRSHQFPRLLDWVGRRAMGEIFRPAATVALEPLIDARHQQLAA